MKSPIDVGVFFRDLFSGCLRHGTLALALCVWLAACGAADPQAGPGLDATGRPVCDDPAVIDQILQIANSHPEASTLLPARALRLGQIEETHAQEISGIGSGTFQRLCVGQMTLANNELIIVGYEIFTTVTDLGPAYGLTPCFGPYDQAARDCSAFAEGRIPGELP